MQIECVCFWPESGPNQFRDCEVEQNIMASDPRALSKEGLYWPRYSWVDFGYTHVHVHTDTSSAKHIHTYTVTYMYSRKVYSAHFTAIHHWHTLMHLWHAHNSGSNAHTHLTRTCLHLHASVLMKHTLHTYTHTYIPWYLKGPFACMNTRTHTLVLSLIRTLPLEHWMQHTRTHCQIDLVPWNAG